MTKAKSFKEKMSELEALLEWFDSEEVNLDEAVKKYEQALELSKELETELTSAKNKIEVLNKKFSR
jgi:exodeoxyribonuclease VII small subunit